jgi:purine-binding chemotaxis protein CheW
MGTHEATSEMTATTTIERAPNGTTATARSGRYLTFVLGGEVFALGILDITEILAYRDLTVVPMMPTFIRGVINLRGRVVPVVDLAARFGKGTTDVARRTSIIIVETAGYSDDERAGERAGERVGERAGDKAEESNQDIGIMVDAVNEVVHFDADDIEPPPAFGAGIRSDFISGMAKHNDEFIIILKVDRIFTVDELDVRDLTSLPKHPDEAQP